MEILAGAPRLAQRWRGLSLLLAIIALTSFWIWVESSDERLERWRDALFVGYFFFTPLLADLVKRFNRRWVSQLLFYFFFRPIIIIDFDRRFFDSFFHHLIPLSRLRRFWFRRLIQSSALEFDHVSFDTKRKCVVAKLADIKAGVAGPVVRRVTFFAAAWTNTWSVPHNNWLCPRSP